MLNRAVGILKKDGKWDRKRIILAALAWLALSFVCLLAIPVEEETPSSSSAPRVSAPTGPQLFVDASEGLEQFVGGQTMPVGTYDFRCSSMGGNYSVQLGRSPYTVSMKTGGTSRIQNGDMVTVGWCKVYGPK